MQQPGNAPACPPPAPERACTLAAAPRLVRTRIGQKPGAPAWILCPDPVLPAIRVPGQRVAFRLLARIADGSVWMLEFDEPLLATLPVPVLLARLATNVARSRNPAALGAGLSEEAHTPVLVAAHPELDRCEAASWKTRRLAMALTLAQAMRLCAPPDAGVAGKLVDAWQARIHHELELARRRFVAALDPELCGLATRAGVLETRLYNYLVEAPHRRNRAQMAAAFPILVRAAAGGRGYTEGGVVRTLVDSGAPLVRLLAHRWQVTPAAVRTLQSCKPDGAGAAWEARPWFLAKVLDAVRPDDRPGPDAHDWQQLNATVDLARRVFGMRPWLSPLALAWIRHCARGRWLARRTLEPLLPATGAPDLPVPLTEAVVNVLVHEAATTKAPDDEVQLEALARAVVVRTLLRMTAARRAEVAQVFNRVRNRDPQRVHREFIAEDDAPLPRLLPGEYVAQDASRVVRNLDCPRAIRAAGQALGNCLARDALQSYVSVCSFGTAFLLGVFEPEGVVPVSVAEFRIRNPDADFENRLALVQHKGYRNGPPSEPCRRAIAQLREQLALGPLFSPLAARAESSLRLRSRPAPDARLVQSVVRPAVVHAVSPLLFKQMTAELARLRVDPTWRVAPGA